MKFWIVTPSYNQCEWLKSCVASIAAQVGEGLDVHHHVQDAGSDDGTVEFLQSHQTRCAEKPVPGYTFSYASEPDEGMYDAINKGWELAPADIDVIAYLNCDEQYQTEALGAVSRFLSRRPKVDVVMANMVVVDGDGEYICQRRPQKPIKAYCYVQIPGFTCTTFLRRRVFFDKQIQFNIKWRDLGDKELFIEMAQKGCSFGMLNFYTSLFTSMPTNMNFGENARREKIAFNNAIPGRLRMLRPLIVKHNQFRFLLRMVTGVKLDSFQLFADYEKPPLHKPINKTKWLWHAYHDLGE